MLHFFATVHAFIVTWAYPPPVALLSRNGHFSRQNKKVRGFCQNPNHRDLLVHFGRGSRLPREEGTLNMIDGFPFVLTPHGEGRARSHENDRGGVICEKRTTNFVRTKTTSTVSMLAGRCGGVWGQRTCHAAVKEQNYVATAGAESGGGMCQHPV